MSSAVAPSSFEIRDVTHRFKRTVAIDGVSLDLPCGKLVGLIGPDGVGKSTLLGLVTGAKKLQEGAVDVLCGPIDDARHRQ